MSSSAARPPEAVSMRS